MADGLRGSLHLGVSGSAWSDTLARNAIYTALGKGAAAPDNGHLVIGDSFTATNGTSSTTKYWSGTSWSNPGVVITGDMIVDGSISATKLVTSELRIPWSTGVTGFTGSATDNRITSATNAASTAQGTANTAANAASDAMTEALKKGMSTSAKNVLTGAGGIKVGTIDWNTSGSVNSGVGVGITQNGIVARNASGPSFVLDGGTGTLTINQVDVINTLNIKGNAVTVPEGAYTREQISGNSVGLTAQTLAITSSGNSALLTFSAHVYSPRHESLYITLKRGSTVIFAGGSSEGVEVGIERLIQGQGTVCGTVKDSPGAGNHTYTLTVGSLNHPVYCESRCITYIEAKR